MSQSMREWYILKRNCLLVFNVFISWSKYNYILKKLKFVFKPMSWKKLKINRDKQSIIRKKKNLKENLLQIWKIVVNMILLAFFLSFSSFSFLFFFGGFGLLISYEESIICVGKRVILQYPCGYRTSNR